MSLESNLHFSNFILKKQQDINVDQLLLLMKIWRLFKWRHLRCYAWFIHFYNRWWRGIKSPSLTPRCLRLCSTVVWQRAKNTRIIREQARTYNLIIGALTLIERIWNIYHKTEDEITVENIINNDDYTDQHKNWNNVKLYRYFQNGKPKMGKINELVK